MKKAAFILSCLLIILFNHHAIAQEASVGGKITGNFGLDAQYYLTDSAINAPKVNEKILMNSFLNILYTNGNFTAGIRYEAYLNPLLGYDRGYAGNGIPYRFATYKKDELEVTVGNFYDQLGNGLIFRSYEDKTLGIDNSIDGLRVKYSILKGINAKVFGGNQRYYWGKSAGLLRGGDIEFNFNDLLKSMENSKTKLILGASAISKFQKDDPTSKYKLPEDVGAFAGRFDISRGRINVQGEYAYKINDPSKLNNYIFRPGQALFLSGSYSRKGLGIIASAKRIDNMNFRTDRLITGNPLTINYLPTISKQHTYALAAIYPYATQPNGEMGYFAQIEYNVKKGSKFGGMYGTDIVIGFSRITDLDRTAPSDTNLLDIPGTLGYQSDFLKFGKTLLFQDFNMEVTHKFNKKWKGIFNLINLSYNKAIIEVHPGNPLVHATIAVADITYKFSEKKAVRVELQELVTKQDKGDWFCLLAEYTIAPSWFFSAMDMYNYGNEEPGGSKLHYYFGSIGYTKGANRIALSYGRQREGLLCIGGVCRQVPASNGFQISITSSF